MRIFKHNKCPHLEHGHAIPKVGRILEPSLGSLMPILILFLFGSISLGAQHNFLLYHMHHIPQANQLNPGQIPSVKEYVGVPFISGIRIGGGGAGISYNDLNTIIGQAEGITNYASIGDQLPRDEGRLLVDTEIQLISLGARTRNGMISLNIKDVAYFSGSFFRSVFTLLDDIQQHTQLAAIGNYDLSGLAVSGAYYRSFSLGYAHQFTEALTVGGRFRWLQGIGGIWTENRNLGLQAQTDDPYFDVAGRLNILSSGLSQLGDSDLYTRLLSSGNGGAAVDLGAVYKFYDLWEFSFSALNIGQINWKKQIDYAVIGDHLSFSNETPEAFIEDWETAVTDQLIGAPANPDVRFTTPLPLKVYMAYLYHVSPTTSIGILGNAIRYNGSTDIAFAISGNTRLNERFALSSGLSFSQYALVNLGVGLSFDLGILQAYFLTDNLPATFNWKSSNAQQIQFGVNLNFGKRKQPTARPKLPFARNHPQPARVQPDPVVPASSEKETPADTSPTTTPSIDEPKDVPETMAAAEFEEVVVSATATTVSIDSNAVDHQTIAQAENLPAHVPEISTPADSNAMKKNVIVEPKDTSNTISGIPASIDSNKIKERGVVQTENSSPSPQASTTTVQNVPDQKKERSVPASPSTVDEVTRSEPQTPVASPKAIPPATEPKLPIYCTLTAATVIRRGPVYTSDEIAPLRAGDQVEVIKKTGKWWWKVRFNGKIGFVKAQLLERARE